MRRIVGPKRLHEQVVLLGTGRKKQGFFPGFLRKRNKAVLERNG